MKINNNVNNNTFTNKINIPVTTMPADIERKLKECKKEYNEIKTKISNARISNKANIDKISSTESVNRMKLNFYNYAIKDIERCINATINEIETKLHTINDFNSLIISMNLEMERYNICLSAFKTFLLDKNILKSDGNVSVSEAKSMYELKPLTPIMEKYIGKSK